MKKRNSSSEDMDATVRSFLDRIINQPPEQLKGDYKVDRVKLDDYMDALSILAEFRRKGQCSFTYDPWFKPYYVHCVYVKWTINNDPCGLPEYPAGKMSELIGKFEGIQLDEQEPFTWQLSSEIYYEGR